MARLDRDKVRKDFAQAVNMTAAEIEKWLRTKESEAVGWKGADGKGSGESVGHASGRRIVRILRKSPESLSDERLCAYAEGGWLCAPPLGAAPGQHPHVPLALQPDELGARPNEIRAYAGLRINSSSRFA